MDMLDSIDYLSGHAPTETTTIQKVLIHHHTGLKYNWTYYYYVDDKNQYLYSDNDLGTNQKGKNYIIHYLPRSQHIMSLKLEK
jgi:hypothetical protein